MRRTKTVGLAWIILTRKTDLTSEGIETATIIVDLCTLFRSRKTDLTSEGIIRATTRVCPYKGLDFMTAERF
ncbi:MAG: hypothetical protein C0403_15505 [Desulfobacterium sp.]|nr:hypothetical protein [Desulfobacterium sp.]